MTLRSKAVLSACLLFAVAGFSATHTFVSDQYMRHVKYLASDQLAGRANGTPEMNKAADYIAKAFKSAKLKPGGDSGSYFQRFMLTTGSKLGPGNKLTLRVGDRTVQANVNKDFLPFSFGDKTNISGEIVFAGYGITAGEYKYDDYKDLDVTDKIVLVMTHEPRENDPASPFNGKEATQYSEDNTKAINAKYRNARAILVVQDPENHPGADALARPGDQIEELGICGIRITRALAQQILNAQSKQLAEVQKQLDERMSPQSFATGIQATLDLDIERVKKEVRNVVAVVPGTDPALSSETIVIGAHYDHLGRGGRSSLSPALVGQIHNGADDNASGTAGVIELGAALATAIHKRTHVFIAFAGEEIGLRGSEYWASHPTLPDAKIIAMINMDMIGRLQANQIYVGGMGTSPAFGDIVKSAADQAGLQVRASQSGYGSSDQTSFYTKNVPVLFFFSGLHADYHRPSDDWQKINAEGATRVLSMVYDVAARLSALETRPQFARVNEPAPSGRGGGAGYGTWFGSIPDMGEEVKGVRFSDVTPNSPAAKAGLKSQDIMIKFAGKDIANLEDFTYMLRTHKPGETVEVVVLRDGKPMTVQVTLGVRK
jgi:aminopeptidase YwaD